MDKLIRATTVNMRKQIRKFKIIFKKEKFRKRGKNLSKALKVNLRHADIIAASLSQIVEDSIWDKLQEWLGDFFKSF
jgi:hypothetical protein